MADYSSWLVRQLETGARRLTENLKDLTPEEATARPQGLAPVIWHVGHLAVHNALALNNAGRPLALPDGYEGVFRKGTDGSGPFPPLEEVKAWYDKTVEELLSLAADTARHGDRPGGGSAWSTVGESLLWMHNHSGYHVGKISTLRALLGKPLLR